jgi:hypothetical protein
MIIGTSHVTLACNDIAIAVRHLVGLGFVLDFAALAAPSSPRKKPYLSFKTDVHDLAFMRSNTGLPIELVRYPRQPSGTAGRYYGIFAGTRPPHVPARALSCAAIASAIGDGDDVVLPGIELPVTIIPRDGLPELIGARLATTNLEAALRFWCDGLGLREITRSAHCAGWRLLEFDSFVPSWRFKLLLIEEVRAPELPTLDAPGLACLSFLSSDLARDSERLLEHTMDEPLVVTPKIRNSEAQFVISARSRLAQRVIKRECSPSVPVASERNRLFAFPAFQGG